MPYIVDFNAVTTVGLELSPVADALAGLRAHEARYFKNKYQYVFTVEPADDAQSTIDWVHKILYDERQIVIASRPLEATAFQLAEGMDVPVELASRFKFARQKSKLAGTIRGSYFTFKADY